MSEKRVRQTRGLWQHAKTIAVILECFVAGALTLSGCGQSNENMSASTNVPSISIEWKAIIDNIKSADLDAMQLYVDYENLESDTEQFGTVSFYNYDVTKQNAFKDVEYQMDISYGAGYEIVDGKINYYEKPVYTISLMDNSSETYYSYTCNEEGEVLQEEGEWFLKESKKEYIEEKIRQCKEIIFGKEQE